MNSPEPARPDRARLLARATRMLATRGIPLDTPLAHEILRLAFLLPEREGWAETPPPDCELAGCLLDAEDAFWSRVREEEPEAWAAFHATWKPLIEGIVRSKYGAAYTGDELDDVCSTFWIRLRSNPYDPSKGARSSSWFREIANSVMDTSYRTRQRAVRRFEPFEEHDVLVAMATEADWETATMAAERIDSLLNRLPEMDRKILLMTRDGFSPLEISEALCISSVKTVNVRVHRARNRLRELLNSLR